MPKILAIDDSEFVCAVIRHVLADEETEIITAGTAKEGIEYARRESPDLILMDVALPDMDGFSACVALKSVRETAEIPVIFLTGHDGVEDMIRGFEAGAVDYINKPFNTTELKARANAHLKTKMMTDDMRLLNENLLIALEENRRLAAVDPLTGLYNRRYGWDYMEQYRLQPDPQPSALLMGDVDDFKKVNDRYGHHTGDAVLCRLSDILRDTVGKDGIICRWGGEEVLVMLHNCTPAEAIECGDNIRKTLNQVDFRCDNLEFHCSVTFGVSPFYFDQSIEHSINRADGALYQGKKIGKNCCMLWE